jgi:hypothetical protein
MAGIKKNGHVRIGQSRGEGGSGGGGRGKRCFKCQDRMAAPADRLLRHRPLRRHVLRRKLLLRMLLVQDRAALRKPPGAAGVAAVRLGQEILRQKLRHFGVELHHALSHSLFVHHQTFHLCCDGLSAALLGAMRAQMSEWQLQPGVTSLRCASCTWKN